MAYEPGAETLEICRDLIRIDTSNYGDDSGPGERKAAEYVAASLAEVGIDSEIVESEPGRASVVARWGNQDSPRDGLLLHGHLDVVPAMAEDWRVDPFPPQNLDDNRYSPGTVGKKEIHDVRMSRVPAPRRARCFPRRA